MHHVCIIHHHRLHHILGIGKLIPHHFHTSHPHLALHLHSAPHVHPVPCTHPSSGISVPPATPQHPPQCLYAQPLRFRWHRCGAARAHNIGACIVQEASQTSDLHWQVIQVS